MTVGAGAPSPIMVGPAPMDPRARTTMVTMPDGVGLATDIYHPADPVGRPTVLVRLPYDKCGRYTFLPEIAAYLTAFGFTVVVQDVRGKFRSEGALVPFVHEAADGAATLDWIVDQPWSSGAVGMLGDSYYGFTQWAAAATGHPALKAIVPRVTGCHFPAMFASLNVPRIPLFEWILHTFSGPGMREDPVATIDDAPRITLPDDVVELVRAVVASLAADADSHAYLTRFFPDRDPAPTLTIPALHMGGWWDNLQRPQLRDWQSVSRSPAARHQFLRMNATDHEDYEWHEFETPHDDHETDRDALTRYLPRMLDEPIAFLDHYLNDRPGSWLAPRVRFKVTTADWNCAAEWPPVDGQDVAMVLSRLPDATGSADGGLLAIGSPCEDSRVSWTHDPRNPVPFLPASEWAQLADLPDEQSLHRRTDVPTFTSEASTRWLELVGPVTAELLVQATSSSTHVIARLLDVYPDGRARVIVEGAAIAQSSDATVKIDLGHTAYRIRAGHRLRLAISSSCFPLYAVHPGNGDDVWQPPRFDQAGISLVSKLAHPPHLRLRVRSNDPTDTPGLDDHADESSNKS